MLLSGSNNFVKAYEKRSSYVLGCYKVVSKRCGTNFRRSHQRCSMKKGVLKEISQNSQGNICSRVSFLKKRLWHRCLPMNFVKFLRTPFLQNTTGRLLLISDDSKYCFGFMLHFRVQDHNFYSIFHNLSNLYNYINI